MVHMKSPFEESNPTVFFVKEFVLSGKRLPIGSETQCPAVLAQIIYSCWTVDPQDRPNISKINGMLGSLANGTEAPDGGI
jgi:hypothetical protein